jgi:hypothetical protein
MEVRTLPNAKESQVGDLGQSRSQERTPLFLS